MLACLEGRTALVNNHREVKRAADCTPSVAKSTGGIFASFQAFDDMASSSHMGSPGKASGVSASELADGSLEPAEFVTVTLQV